ncbi:MAG: YdcF family protein [Bacteroidetes bacterium]|nr:MAG: YdcF family protein [Bacteroidota bacterium]
MFFLLSKSLLFIALPLNWIIGLGFYTLFCKNEQRRKKMMILNLFMLIFFTNPILVNEALTLWEIAPIPLKEVKNYDVGIVLTGFTQDMRSPKDRIYFEKGADRLMHAVKLYRLGKIRKIMISGASEFDWKGGVKSEITRSLKDVLLDCGIPNEDILVENSSKNTYENAIFSTKILTTDFANQRFLLITSAFHLRRAKACFDKAGLKTDMFACDFYSTDRNAYFLPDPQELEDWNRLIKEWIGFVVYWAKGWV